MKNFFDEIIEVVHGSSLTKKELQKKLVETLPQLKRKSEKIKTFLSTYCERGHEKVVIRPVIKNAADQLATTTTVAAAIDGSDLTKDKKVIRQIVNTDKVVQDLLGKANSDVKEDKEELKARVSRQLDDIMQKRISKEFEEQSKSRQ